MDTPPVRSPRRTPSSSLRSDSNVPLLRPDLEMSASVNGSPGILPGSVSPETPDTPRFAAAADVSQQAGAEPSAASDAGGSTTAGGIKETHSESDLLSPPPPRSPAESSNSGDSPNRVRFNRAAPVSLLAKANPVTQRPRYLSTTFENVVDAEMGTAGAWSTPQGERVSGSAFERHSLQPFDSTPLPGATAPGVVTGGVGEHPNGRLNITINHVLLGPKLVNDCEIFPLTQTSPGGMEGSALYCSGPHEWDSRVRTLPNELSQGVYYIKADLNDMFFSGKHVYISGIANHCCVRLYVLYPSTMKEPKWLRQDFVQERDDFVTVDWEVSRAQRFLLWMAKKWQLHQQQVLNVWVSKKTYKPKEQFVLCGADATGDLTDGPYVLAFRVAAGSLALQNKSVSRREDSNHASITRMRELLECGDMNTLGTMLQSHHLDLPADSGGLLGAAKSDTATPAAQPSDIAPLNARGVLDLCLRLSNIEVLRTLIESETMSHHLSRRDVALQVSNVIMHHGDTQLLMKLYSPERPQLELNKGALAFIIHMWAKMSNDRDELNSADYVPLEVDRYLVTYILKHRNPLSTSAAILQAIRTEQLAYEESRRFMRLMYSKFHSLHLAILQELDKYTQIKQVKVMDTIMQPTLHPRSINDESPSQVAFELNDIMFMAHKVMADYTAINWRGIEYARLTCQQDPRSMSIFSPFLGYRVMRNLGLAGGFADPMFKLTMRMWHTYLLSSYAFFHAPRGRWAFAVMSEAAFLSLYQIIMIWPFTAYVANLHIAFVIFLVGNLVDIFVYVRLRYGSIGRLRKYVDEPWNALNLLTNAALLVTMSFKMGQDWGAPLLPPHAPYDIIHICTASLAVLVWLRTLGIMVPIFPVLGPLLNTMARMVEEVAAFMLPMAIILTGFATMLAGVLWKQLSAYYTFQQSLYTTFQNMLGQFDFTIFSAANGLTSAEILWAKIMMAIFLMLSTILLLNLLIAIIQKRYNPDEVEAESLYRTAQVVDQYQIQVKFNLIGSPCNLLQLLVWWLPKVHRKKIRSGRASRFLLPPLDGFAVPEDTYMVDAGRGEFPHLVFLLTFYPFIALATNLLFLFYAPFGAIFFGSSGRNKWRQLQKKKAPPKLEHLPTFAMPRRNGSFTPQPADGRTPSGAPTSPKSPAAGYFHQQPQPQQQPPESAASAASAFADGSNVAGAGVGWGNSALLPVGSEGWGNQTLGPLAGTGDWGASTLAAPGGWGVVTPNSANSAGPSVGAGGGGGGGWGNHTNGHPANSPYGAGHATFRSRDFQMPQVAGRNGRADPAKRPGAEETSPFRIFLLQLPTNLFFTFVGLLLHLGIWLFFIFLWSTVWVWLAKVAFSLYNLFIRSLWALIKSFWKSSRGRRRPRAPAASTTPVSPAETPTATQGGASAVAKTSEVLNGSMHLEGGVSMHGGVGEESFEESASAKFWKGALRQRHDGKDRQYITENDVLKGISRSKFLGQMESWGLEPQPLTRLDEEEEQIRALEPTNGLLAVVDDAEEEKQRAQVELLSNMMGVQKMSKVNEALIKQMQELLAQVAHLHLALRHAGVYTKRPSVHHAPAHSRTSVHANASHASVATSKKVGAAQHATNKHSTQHPPSSAVPTVAGGTKHKVVVSSSSTAAKDGGTVASSIAHTAAQQRASSAGTLSSLAAGKTAAAAAAALAAGTGASPAAVAAQAAPQPHTSGTQQAAPSALRGSTPPTVPAAHVRGSTPSSASAARGSTLGHAGTSAPVSSAGQPSGADAAATAAVDVRPVTPLPSTSAPTHSLPQAVAGSLVAPAMAAAFLSPGVSGDDAAAAAYGVVDNGAVDQTTVGAAPAVAAAATASAASRPSTSQGSSTPTASATPAAASRPPSQQASRPVSQQASRPGSQKAARAAPPAAAEAPGSTSRDAAHEHGPAAAAAARSVDVGDGPPLRVVQQHGGGGGDDDAT